MPERTATYITDTRQQLLNDVWQNAHKNWQEWLDYYELKHQIRFVQPAQPRKLPFMRAKIDATVDSLVTNEPVVTRKPVREGEEHKRLADRAEKWAKGLLEKGAQVWGPIPPFRAAAKYLALFGYAVMIARWDSAAWPEKPKRGQGRGYQERVEKWEQARENGFPFILEAPHPARVLLPPMERRPEMAIESVTLYGWEVERDYPEVGFKGRPFDLVEAILYWEKDWMGMVVQSELVMGKPNLYGFVPYTQAFSGGGLEHSPMYGSSPKEIGLGPRPEDLSVGQISGNEDIVRAMDEMASAQLHLALQSAYRVRLTSGNNREIAQQFQEAGLGGVVQVPTGDLKWEEPPAVSPQVFAVLDLYRNALDIGTFSGVVQGQRDPGTATATQHAMMLGAARMKFGMPMQQLNFMAGELVGYCAKMVEVQEERVKIGGIEVTGKDFEGNYDFKVNFLAKDEAENLRERERGQAEVRDGMRSLESWLERTGESDATGELDRIVIERLLRSPQADALIMALVEKRWREKLGLPAPVVQTPVAAPGVTQPIAPPQASPAPFVAQPGGPQEAGQVMQGMTQTPGGGMVRAGM